MTKQGYATLVGGVSLLTVAGVLLAALFIYAVTGIWTL